MALIPRAASVVSKFARFKRAPTSECELTSTSCLGQRKSGPTIHDFASRTTERIGIGSTIEDLTTAYRQPESTELNVVSCIRRGMTFHLVKGKVGGFQVREPVSDDIEIIANENGFTMRVKETDE